MQKSDVLERFLRYVQVHTTADDKNYEVTPSSPQQFDLARLLVEELHAMGISEASVDEHAYVTASIPATAGLEDLPALGLIAHIDTSPDAPGKNVKPQVITYNGGAIDLTGDGSVCIEPDQNPMLAQFEGEDLVVTDGTTLLGADDKAGVAEIMALAARLMAHPEIKHPAIKLCFPPDEEIGHGASLLDIEKFGAAFAYTVDGGEVGQIEYECFNAAHATVHARGVMIHPGDAKDRMINAAHLLKELDAALPNNERPEHTKGREGFYHLLNMSANVSEGSAEYIIRDHDNTRFDERKARMLAAAAAINERLADRPNPTGKPWISVEIRDEYRNMREVVEQHPELIVHAEEAFRAIGVEPVSLPIRGGTDGAQLSLRGLACPNLSTGGMNFHSVQEWIAVSSLERMVDMLTELVQLFARK